MPEDEHHRLSTGRALPVHPEDTPRYRWPTRPTTRRLTSYLLWLRRRKHGATDSFYVADHPQPDGEVACKHGKRDHQSANGHDSDGRICCPRNDECSQHSSNDAVHHGDESDDGQEWLPPRPVESHAPHAAGCIVVDRSPKVVSNLRSHLDVEVPDAANALEISAMVGRKVPGDGGVLIIAGQFPGGNLTAESLRIGDAPIHALCLASWSWPVLAGSGVLGPYYARGENEFSQQNDGNSLHEWSQLWSR
jgi:hypothetical protein